MPKPTEGNDFPGRVLTMMHVGPEPHDWSRPDRGVPFEFQYRLEARSVGGNEEMIRKRVAAAAIPENGRPLA
jgi:hypothetical protein